MQLTKQEIIEKLKNILSQADPNSASKIETADESTDLKNDFGFSSVNMLYLMIAIEETFGIRFENVTMGDFITLGDVVNYIQSK